MQGLNFIFCPKPPTAPLSLRALRVYLEAALEKIEKFKSYTHVIVALKSYSLDVRRSYERLVYLEQEMIASQEALDCFQFYREIPDGISQWLQDNYENYFNTSAHGYYLKNSIPDHIKGKVMWVLSYRDHLDKNVNIYLDLDSIDPIMNFNRLYKMLYKKKFKFGLFKDLEKEYCDILENTHFLDLE